MLFSIVAITAAVASSVSAAAITKKNVLDVWTPKVTSPKKGDEWKVNSTQTVTWDVSDAPANITNKQGRIQLRRNDYTFPIVLQDDFDITLGGVDVVVPWFQPADDYVLVLFGDSGNFGEEFAIVN